jgi:hypothetical protein
MPVRPERSRTKPREYAGMPNEHGSMLFDLRRAKRLSSDTRTV